MAPLFRIFLLFLALACNGRGEPLLRLEMDPRASSVNFDVESTVSSFTGTLRAHEANVQVEPGDGRIVACRFSFRLLDLLTGRPGRDTQMGRWLDAKLYPDAHYELGSLEPSGVDGVETARGFLTLHGVRSPLSFPLRVARSGGRLSLEGEAVVDVRLHGLPVLRFLGVCKVDPRVRVRFHLEGLAPTTPPTTTAPGVETAAR